ncbi:LysR family transcriptional regulator [Clostridium sp. MCC353]|uniref:helix-turn-helix domain-containing protein n=1 Tax=Clostridium sp. MCC353 TaxID=2592646 RepID=UPI001C0183F3|nr:LysR family transcriptional regulator [Clostridium sp. MCC353]
MRCCKKAFVSQPSLSQTLLQMEQDFGRRIFIRSSEGLKATEFGNLSSSQDSPPGRDCTRDPLYYKKHGTACYCLDESLKASWKLVVAYPGEKRLSEIAREFLRIFKEQLAYETGC